MSFSRLNQLWPPHLSIYHLSLIGALFYLIYLYFFSSMLFSRANFSRAFFSRDAVEGFATTNEGFATTNEGFEFFEGDYNG